MQLVEIKGLNAFVDNKSSFDQPIKYKKADEKLIEMSRNNYYTIGKLLDYSYHSYQ